MVTSDGDSAFLALGSNIEPSVRHMLAALHLLDQTPGIDISRVSHAYRSEAHTTYGGTQRDYLNAVANVRTDLQPSELLSRCLEIELMLGRDSQDRGTWTPRTIDLDILLHSAGSVDRANLHVPHPRMRDRLFVLLPLAEIVGPDHYLEEFGETMSGLVAHCTDAGRTVKTIVDLNNYK